MAMTESEFWVFLHAERARIGDMLEGLSDSDWEMPSLCDAWTVRDVVAHLTAAATTTKMGWFRSMLKARFNVANHNARFVNKHLGHNHAGTFQGFLNSINNKIVPSKDYAAWLGEVIVHGQDIAMPLGVTLQPDPHAVVEVAEFFATRNFAVSSKSTIEGLSLIATDSEFQAGDGPDVRGTTLDLVMAMAGRSVFADGLAGQGADDLRQRLTAPVSLDPAD